MTLGLLAAGLFLAGCGAQPQASAVEQPLGTLKIRGGVMGGQQPVYHSLIGLYAAGAATDYGQGATNLMTSTAYTDAGGNFSIGGDYSACPSADAQVYLTATGGDPSGHATTFSNDAIQMVAALGPCSQLGTGTFIIVNEVTTVAAAFALGQFYGGFGTTSDMIGAPATNSVGLINAFATAHNLASTSKGLATPTSAASGTNYYLVAPDQQKLNTMANILSDCTNQVANATTTCANLFSYVTPTGAAAAVNTFQAAVYMSLYSTSTNASGGHLSDLFAQQSAFMPFAPALSGAPTDWTLAIQYTGTGINYGSSIAVDANGDVWMSNAGTVGGVVLVNGGTGTVGGTKGVAGGVIGYYSGPTAYPFIVPNGVRQVAIDLNGKAWYSGFNGTGTTTASGTANYYLFRATGGSANDGYYPLPSPATFPYAIAVDPLNEVFGMTSGGTLAYAPATSATGTNLTEKFAGSSSGDVNVAIDTAKNGYVAGTNGSLYTFNSGTQALDTTYPIATTGFSSPYGTAIDAQNRLWVANDPSSAFYLTIYDPANSTSHFTNITNTCLQKPGFIAFDGSGNAWVTNQNAFSGSNFGVCVFDSAGNLLSNSTGYNNHGVVNERGIGIDPSGNVWLSNYISSSTTTLTELVGAATPAVTPIAVAIKNGKVGVRP